MVAQASLIMFFRISLSVTFNPDEKIMDSVYKIKEVLRKYAKILEHLFY